MISEMNIFGEGCILPVWDKFDLDNLIGILDRQWKNRNVNQGEEGRIYPNAQSQNEYNRGGQARVFTEHTHPVAKVLPQIRNHIDPPVCAQHDRFLRRLKLNSLQFPSEQLVITQLR